MAEVLVTVKTDALPDHEFRFWLGVAGQGNVSFDWDPDFSMDEAALQADFMARISSVCNANFSFVPDPVDIIIVGLPIKLA